MSTRRRRSVHSLGRRLLPAVAMTGAAAGLIAVLDRPLTGASGDVIGDEIGVDPLGEGSLPDTPVADTQPPQVSSTLPVIAGDDESDDESDDAGEEEDDEGFPVAPSQSTTPPSTTVPTQAPPAPTGPCEGQTIDGPSVSTRWGPVQVEAVVSSTGQICDVTALRSPDSRRRSVSINEQALPILHDRVMKAQSTKIRVVSGATVTTEGYVKSLQAILDGNAG